MQKNQGPQTLDLPETQLLDDIDAWEMEHAFEMELMREQSPPPQLNQAHRSKRRLFHEGPGSDEPSGSSMPGISRIPTADILELDLQEMSKPTASASTTSPNRNLESHPSKKSRLILEEPDDFDLLSEEKENRMEPEKVKPVRPPPSSSLKDNPLGRSALSKMRPSGRSIQITGPDGTVLYAKVKNAEQMKELRKRQEHHELSAHLLSMPISFLLHEIRYEKVTSDLEARENKRLRATSGESPAPPKPQKLWVDKYAPSQFIDLLSDQQTNRHVLKWIKSWDECVFGNKASTKLKSETKPLLPKSLQTKKSGPEPGHTSKDLYHRPEKKILLICGPPGMGKTTLANVAARQAGYNVVEINASDERTSEVLQKKILAASEMKSVFGNNKPNCIIIDEIDGLWNGTGQNPMLAILKLLKGEGKVEKADEGEQDDTKEKGKKGKLRPLCRPIICICNDQYAPVLRPLRQESLVLAMRHGNNSRFAERLKEICTKENLQVDLKALANLSDMTEHDIRACLNTLQFLRSKGGTVVTSSMLSSIGVGQKDMKKSLFGIWENLFHVAKGRANEQIPTPTRFFNQLLATVEAADDQDILLSGCFHNYLSVLSNELTFDKINNVLEWMHFRDSIQQACIVRQEYEFLAYSSFAIVQFFPNCATSKRPALEFPKREFEVQAQLKGNSSILQTVMDGLPSHFKFITKTMMVKDFLSPLMRIISPINFRPLNVQLLTPHELKILERLVDVMIGFNLTFVQVKGLDDQYTYNLEAPIDQLLWFNVEKKKSFIPYNYSAKQLISNEIEREKLRRSDTKRANANANVPAGSSSAPLARSSSSASSSTTPSSAPSSEPYNPFNFEFQKLSPKKIKPVQVEIPKDFFGRPIIVEPPAPKEAQSNSKAPPAATSAPSSAPQTRIWYKFNEGFSNAVRKPVFIRDLL